MLTSYAELHMPRTGHSRCWLVSGRVTTQSGSWRPARAGRMTNSAQWLMTRGEQAEAGDAGHEVGGGGGGGGGGGVALDELACSTSEQWRQRVGSLWRLPYVEHPPDALPTADARLVERKGWDAAALRLDTAQFGAAETAEAADGKAEATAVVACFPYQYALPGEPEGDGRCVPMPVVPMVRRRTCRNTAQSLRQSWSPWDAWRPHEHDLNVFHDDHAPITAQNLGDMLRQTGGKIGGVSACSLPGLACSVGNHTELAERARRRDAADAGAVRYGQLPRSMRRIKGSLG